MALGCHVKRDSIPSPKANPVGGFLAVDNVGTLVLDTEDGRRRRGIDDGRGWWHVVERDLLGACTTGDEDEAQNGDEVPLTPRHDRLLCCPTSLPTGSSRRGRGIEPLRRERCSRLALSR